MRALATIREADLAVFDPDRTREAARDAGTDASGSPFAKEVLSHVLAAKAEGRRRVESALGGKHTPAGRIVRAVVGACAVVDGWARRGLASLFGVKAKEAEKEAARQPQPADEGPGAPAHAAEARPEGYLVSRVAGEDALREAPLPLTEDRLAPAEPPPPSPPLPPIDWLGELPWAYDDDTFVALPRDPMTMWLFWDFSPATLARAREGIDDPRVRLRVFDGNTMVRELDLALESRSFYVADLPSGRSYRGELVFVGRNGERLIGHPSNPVHLPPVGPSPVIDDRFATIPWGLPLGPNLDLFAHGAPGPDLSNLQRQALRSASHPDRRLGASERMSVRAGGSLSARILSSSPGGPGSRDTE